MTRYLACFIAVLALYGCSASSKQERHWTEEVLLEDGSTVQIERYVAFDATNALGGGAGNAVESKSTLQFKGEFASLPPWDFPRAALVLYRSKETSNWILVATTSSCQLWRRQGKPKPPYWQYELKGNTWSQVPLSQESMGKVTNLFYSYWKDDFPSHVTPTLKSSKQSDPAIVELYRQISASPRPRDFNCNE